MRISLPSRGYGFALALLSIVVGVLFVLALPAGARAAEACPNEQVRAESNVNPSTGEPYDMGLPQCRAYEMASPPDKEGHDAWTFSPQQTFATDGSVVYVSEGEFNEPEGGTGFLVNNNYRSARGVSSWSTTSEFLPVSISPQPLQTSNEVGWPFAPDLSRVAVCGQPGEGSSTVEAAVVCGLHESDGSWVASPVFPGTANTQTGEKKVLGLIYGGSRDLSHLFFMLSGHSRLLAADIENSVEQPCSGGSGIYEVAGLGTGGPVALRLVNVDNTGAEIGSFEPKLGDACAPGGSGASGTAFHAVSEDGETVYFEATPPGGVQTLYARIGAAHTVAISEPTVADCSECQTSVSVQKGATFQGASADGTEVFFTTEQELLPGRRSSNLYEYEANAPAGHRISAVTAGSTKAEVQGVLRNSGDGSHVYFVAKSVLATEPNSEGQEARFGADNLYVYERDSVYPAGHTAFVGMLCLAENLSGVVLDNRCAHASETSAGVERNNDAHLWSAVDGGSHGERNEDITRNGNYIVFETHAHLSSEDHSIGASVYRYDALTGQLTWISHPASGFSGYVDEGLGSHIPPRNGGNIGASPAVEDSARVISENGEDIVFTTGETLQLDDVNKVTPINEGLSNDVYLWHDGTVSMVSDGHSEGISTVPAMSPSGSDIYVQMRTELVGQDIDQNQDIYDARVDGGFPAPVVPPMECGLLEEGEACQGSLSGLPVFSVPGSVSFTSGANVVPVVGVEKGPVVKPKSLSRAQKLAAALKVCRKGAKRKRAGCEARARKRYGVKSKSKGTKSNRRGKS